MSAVGARRVHIACRALATGAAVLASVLFAQSRPVAADITSSHPAAILVFPKLLVDTSNGLNTLVRITNVSQSPINVKCFYVNTTPTCSVPTGSCFPNQLSCTGIVGGIEQPGTCLPQWQETDFLFRLTLDQPTGWLVSGGEGVDCRLIDGVCSNDGTTVCDTDTPCGTGNRCVRPACLPLDGPPLGRSGPNMQLNQGKVPIAPQDPFVGELKCIALDDSEAPAARNDLIGSALIGRLQAGPDERIEVAGYNAVGIPAIPNTGNRDNTLVLGGPTDVAEYEGCPNVLILDHYFDGAVDPVLDNSCQADNTCTIDGVACTSNADCLHNRCVNDLCTVTGTACMADPDCDNVCNGKLCSLSGGSCVSSDDCPSADFQVRVATALTLVPCTEDFEEQNSDILATTTQFLVYNEFEERFSTSIPVDCFKEIQLSDIVGKPNEFSIFSAGVAGTLTGQSRIRGVVSKVNTGLTGNTLIGVAEEFRCAGPSYDFPLCNFVDAQRMVSGNAKNLHFQGRRAVSDFIYLPARN